MKLAHVRLVCPVAMAAILVVVSSSGCSTRSPGLQVGRDDARILDKGNAAAAAGAFDETHTIDLDLLRLEKLSRELDFLGEEVSALQRFLASRAPGDYSPDDQERLAGVLFRYLLLRETLWDIVAFHADNRSLFSTPRSRAMSFLISYDAFLKVNCIDARLVNTFVGSPGTQAKLNEAYPPYEIPAGVYSKIESGVTSIDNLESARAAWELFDKEARNPRSALSKLCDGKPKWSTVRDEVVSWHVRVEAQTQRIIDRKAAVMPNVANRLRHSAVADAANRIQAKFKDGLDAAQATFYVSVARLRTPGSGPIRFDADQVRQIHELLQPGDLLFSYSEGYMCNLFLPGTFKHGMTYVGNPGQRTAIATLATDHPTGTETRQKDLARSLARPRTDAGQSADIIEAIAEGVIFSSLDEHLRTHFNRLLVLRPVLTVSERARQLRSVFLLAGGDYDFKFDFTEASEQCCTEVIYRSLNSLGKLQWKLRPRLGRLTLSADDIINGYLQAPGNGLDLVLIAVEAPTGGHKAVVMTGSQAQDQLRGMMRQ